MCPGARVIKLKGFFCRCLSASNSTSNKCRVKMEAIQQVVVCRVEKVAVKRKTKTRKQRLAEDPTCPVCLEELTEETLCKPVKCHNICVDCRPVCNKCPLCRKGWTSNKQVRKKCESGACNNMTNRKCIGLEFMGRPFVCDNHICGRHRHGRCVRCSKADMQLWITIATRRETIPQLMAYVRNMSV
jgi:hypothetical protein